ncbi:hypothetical protein RRG08_035170 [Elysia crispata]|uniref:Uncharacterized protein n=1 Tax=Elysia crispata TaxID=231223 RepID=A0AAE1EBE3_9GAST|nr:hypothetical protein RRG08_035170 [Elysia crispata]
MLIPISSNGQAHILTPICVHYPRLCYEISYVIGALCLSVVFGYNGILLIFGIFLTYETRSVKLKQFTDSLDRMLNTPDNSLITSQADLRPCSL